MHHLAAFIILGAHQARFFQFEPPSEERRGRLSWHVAAGGGRMVQRCSSEAGKVVFSITIYDWHCMGNQIPVHQSSSPSVVGFGFRFSFMPRLETVQVEGFHQ